MGPLSNADFSNISNAFHLNPIEEEVPSFIEGSPSPQLAKKFKMRQHQNESTDVVIDTIESNKVDSTFQNINSFLYVDNPNTNSV